MLRIKEMLIPVDFSAASMVAIRYGRTLARGFEASVTLLHAGAPEEQARRKLEEIACAEFGVPPFTAVALPGDPARVIVDYARSRKSDLIVMSTHGYGPFRRLLLGSVTTAVLDETECPVFTGAHLEETVASRGARFDNVVCAVDLGPKARDIAAWAGEFATAAGGRLFLVHVVPDLGAAAGDYFRADANLAPVQQAAEELAEMREALHLAAKVIVAGGAISDAIRLQVSELRADVLVAGRGTRTGRIGRLRSNAFDIIRTAPCPVITV